MLMLMKLNVILANIENKIIFYINPLTVIKLKSVDFYYICMAYALTC